MSKNATGEQPTTMEVENLSITVINTTESVLIPPAYIPKSFCVGFKPKLPKRVQVENMIVIKALTVQVREYHRQVPVGLLDTLKGCL